MSPPPETPAVTAPDTAVAPIATTAQTPETGAAPTVPTSTPASIDAQSAPTAKTMASPLKRPASVMEATESTSQEVTQQQPATSAHSQAPMTAAPVAPPIYPGSSPGQAQKRQTPPGLRPDQPAPRFAPISQAPPQPPVPPPGYQAIAFTAMNTAAPPSAAPPAKRRKTTNKQGRPSKHNPAAATLAARPLPALQPAPARPARTFTPPPPEQPKPPRMSFYSLPPELREEIYKLSLGNLHIHILPLNSPRERKQHDLTLVSHQIRSEVLPLIHKTRPITAYIHDYNFDGLLAWLARIPVAEPKDTLCKNSDLRILLDPDGGKRTKPTNFDSLKKWVHVRSDPYRFQPGWRYEGPAAMSKTATELRRRVARASSDERRKKVLMDIAKAVGVQKLDCVKPRGSGGAAKKGKGKAKESASGVAEGAGDEREAAEGLVEAMDVGDEGEEGEGDSSDGEGSAVVDAVAENARAEGATDPSLSNDPPAAGSSVGGFRPAGGFVPVNAAPMAVMTAPLPSPSAKAKGKGKAAAPRHDGDAKPGSPANASALKETVHSTEDTDAANDLAALAAAAEMHPTKVSEDVGMQDVGADGAK